MHSIGTTRIESFAHCLITRHLDLHCISTLITWHIRSLSRPCYPLLKWHIVAHGTHMPQRRGSRPGGHIVARAVTWLPIENEQEANEEQEDEHQGDEEGDSNHGLASPSIHWISLQVPNSLSS